MKNYEHYNDPTASEALGKIYYEEKIKRKHNILLNSILEMCDNAGFSLTKSIELKHNKSGKAFK